MEQPLKIVIADDNEELCLLLEQYFLKRKDIVVVGKAFDGEKTLEVLEKTKPDILLLDIIMPRLDGLAVLSKIPDLEQKQLKTIIITAFGQEHVIQRAAELGAYYYLIKPFDFSVLAKRILEFTSKKTNHKLLSRERIDLFSLTSHILDRICIPPNFKGYSYIITAVSLIIANWNLLHSVTKHLYPSIGEIHQANTAQVERSIRHAIEYAWLKSEPEVLNTLFGNIFSEEIGRPTNAAFLGRLAELVRQEMVS